MQISKTKSEAKASQDNCVMKQNLFYRPKALVLRKTIANGLIHISNIAANITAAKHTTSVLCTFRITRIICKVSKEIKESDSNTALTERGLSRLVEEKKIVSTIIGNRNLIDMDQLYDYLSGKNRS